MAGDLKSPVLSPCHCDSLDQLLIGSHEEDVMWRARLWKGGLRHLFLEPVAHDRLDATFGPAHPGGGHMCTGYIVRTTVELLVAPLPRVR